LIRLLRLLRGCCGGGLRLLPPYDGRLTRRLVLRFFRLFKLLSFFRLSCISWRLRVLPSDYRRITRRLKLLIRLRRILGIDLILGIGIRSSHFMYRPLMYQRPLCLDTNSSTEH
jgi:hypothetical protein